jgi:hypothetical protein
MRNRSFSVAAAILLGLALAPFAYAANYHVKPGVFVGKAAQCSPLPAGSRIVGSDWVNDFGLPDDHGHDNQALMLSKNGLTSDCSAAGATIHGVKEITLTELGFDIRNGGHCGSGAPRFNVDASDGFHFAGGCANGTKTLDTPQQGWTRVRIDPSNGAQCFPPIAPGATVNSIEIVFDEGTDTGTDFSGFAMLDNIDINGTLVGRH